MDCLTSLIVVIWPEVRLPSISSFLDLWVINKENDLAVANINIDLIVINDIVGHSMWGAWLSTSYGNVLCAPWYSNSSVDVEKINCHICTYGACWIGHDWWSPVPTNQSMITAIQEYLHVFLPKPEKLQSWWFGRHLWEMSFCIQFGSTATVCDTTPFRNSTRSPQPLVFFVQHVYNQDSVKVDCDI